MSQKYRQYIEARPKCTTFWKLIWFQPENTAGSQLVPSSHGREWTVVTGNEPNFRLMSLYKMFLILKECRLK